MPKLFRSVLSNRNRLQVMYNFKYSSSHIKKVKKKETGEITFNSIFYLA